MVNKQFEIIKFAGDLFSENSYLCVNSQTNAAIIIDPGTLKIVDYLADHPQINLKAVLLTHGHSDHIMHADYYVDNYQVPLYIHEYDAGKLTNPDLSLSSYSGNFIIESKPTIVSGTSGKLNIPDFTIEFELAAGHSEGQIIFHLLETNIYFVGDTVFSDSIGRYDLPGANTRSHYETLNKINNLADESKLYPGHGKNFLKHTLAENSVFQMFIKLGV